MIVDANVSLSRWPFRRLAGDDPAGLILRLRERGVTQAWAASFDGIFHKDLSGANERLARDCREYGQGILVPFGSVNPKLPDWQEDLRRCHEVYRMPGIRLHPNYHGYTLNDAAFAELLKLASDRKLVVQLAAQVEDERTQHPLMRVAPVDLAPLADAAAREPQLRLMVLNWSPVFRGALQNLAQAERISFDCAMLEGAGGIARLAQQIPLRRILFGSNFPLFYFESARLKVREAGLSEKEETAVLADNARALRS